MESSRREDLLTDIAEIDRLLQSSTRPRLKQATEAELKAIPVEQSPAPQSVAQGEGLLYKTIDKFAWEQEGKNVKIYCLDMPGVRDLPSEAISFSFTETSVDLKIHGYNGQNYRLSFKRLHDKIKSARFSPRSNGFSITLTKESSGSWPNIEFKKTAVSNKPTPPAKEEDPNASIMNMMRQLYDEGDDDMKRTIAEAWTKAREDKTA